MPSYGTVIFNVLRNVHWCSRYSLCARPLGEHVSKFRNISEATISGGASQRHIGRSFQDCHNLQTTQTTCTDPCRSIPYLFVLSASLQHTGTVSDVSHAYYLSPQKASFEPTQTYTELNKLSNKFPSSPEEFQN